MTTQETSARAGFYGVSPIPDVYVDGMYHQAGASSCPSAATTYRNWVNQRMSQTGGISPVSVTGYFSSYEGAGSLQATFELLDPASLGSLQAVLYLYEDNVYWCCGYGGVSTWNEVARVVRTQPVTLTNVGDRVTVAEGITLDPSWNVANLHAFALIQQTTGSKTIIQAGRLTPVTDFALLFPVTLGSVPAGNGTATFNGTVRNVSSVSDVITLAVDNGFGWPADFQVAGDPTWYTSTTVALAPGVEKAITVRVQTDGNRRIGLGHFSATSSVTGRQQPTSLRVFNGSPAILLVDDDNGSQDHGVDMEVIFENGLNNKGYLYDNWDVAGGHAGSTPTPAQVVGYDVIVWETAYVNPPLLSDDDISLLEGFLDAGGSLYLDSMQFLNSQSAPNTFTTNYLGVASWTLDTHANTASGVAGDPITDGMVLPLTWPSSTLNKVDTVNPTASSSAIFFSETNNPAAVRHALASGGRVVFNSIIQNAISTTDAPPNNSDTVLDRVIQWLANSVDPASVAEQPANGVTRLLAALPNPLQDRTDLHFWLSSAAATQPMNLAVMDASGRLIRTLISGRVAAGEHRVAWDGIDAAGRPVASGAYFVRLRSVDQDNTTKLVVIR